MRLRPIVRFHLALRDYGIGILESRRILFTIKGFGIEIISHEDDIHEDIRATNTVINAVIRSHEVEVWDVPDFLRALYQREVAFKFKEEEF